MTSVNLALAMGKWVVEAWRRRGLRRYLAEADEYLLADIGVSRAQALFELERDRPPSATLSSFPRCPSPLPRNRAT
jgi:uncharacterized protein YjiS (DUF1127 family)